MLHFVETQSTSSHHWPEMLRRSMPIAGALALATVATLALLFAIWLDRATPVSPICHSAGPQALLWLQEECGR